MLSKALIKHCPKRTNTSDCRNHTIIGSSTEINKQSMITISCGSIAEIKSVYFFLPCFSEPAGRSDLKVEKGHNYALECLNAV